MTMDFDETPAAYDEIPFFRPDVVLPTQWSSERKPSRARDGIGKLALAILEDAINVIQKYGDGRKVKAYQVRSDLVWIFSKREGPFSMVSCCDMIDVNPDAIQRGMHEYVDNHKARFALLN